jgi:lipid II:glycine glycyltransferase (peptidoglycan interpeptide bridge formation enzyme)
VTTDAERWDAQLASVASPAPLLQSWAWGEVQSRAGWKAVRIKMTSGAVASVLVRTVGPLREAYVPRGPVPASAEAIDVLVDWAHHAKMARLVVEPEASKLSDAFRERGWRRTKPIQPQHTRILKLRPPAEMLPAFRHGRRYNIRTGEKRGVVVEEGKDAGELERQSHAVERRESINLPARRYYQLLLDTLPWCRTYTAYSPDKHEPLATVLVARHAGRAYSLFAGRSGRRTELMGNDLAWWSAIKSAAEAGCDDFDLWGVPPPDAPPGHPWAGIGAFKAEFGGEVVSYTGAWELVISAGAAALVDAEKTARAHIRRLKRNIS